MVRSITMPKMATTMGVTIRAVQYPMPQRLSSSQATKAPIM